MNNKKYYKADPNCALCKGSAWMDRDGDRVQCLCILKQRALDYLGAIYRNAVYFQGLNPEPTLKNFNILVQQEPEVAFKSFVKSILLNTGMKYSHLTYTGYDIVNLYLADKDGTWARPILETDFMIYWLGEDPKNSAYGDVLRYILQKRILDGKRNWIFSKFNIKSGDFYEKYTLKLSEFIQSGDTFKIEYGLMNKMGMR